MFSQGDFFGYERYTLRSDTVELSVISLGGAITTLRYRGEDTVLHFADAAGYENCSCYLNFVVGRYANRIKGGRVTISGREYQLDQNEGQNQLHGGRDGLHRKRWTLKEHDETSFTLSCVSPDGECGYPGTLKASVTYSVTGNTVTLRFRGVSDRDTIFAPTIHTYFALTENCLDTKLRMNAAAYLPTDGENLPLAPKSVDKEFDFRKLRAIERDYDHCFLPDGQAMALMVGEKTAIAYRTDFPAMQLYTGAFLEPDFPRNAGFALEPEFCPDSPNRSEFASPLLRAGECFDRFVEYRFMDAEEIKE